MKTHDRFINSIRYSEVSPQAFAGLQTFSCPKYYAGDSSQHGLRKALQEPHSGKTPWDMS